jgi:hypothetical protein
MLFLSFRIAGSDAAVYCYHVEDAYANCLAHKQTPSVIVSLSPDVLLNGVQRVRRMCEPFKGLALHCQAEKESQEDHKNLNWRAS